MNLGPYELDQIYTGDARELVKAIPDESVDLVLLDPPFGIGFNYGNGYNDDAEKYTDLIQWTVDECIRVIKTSGLCFVFVAQLRLRHIWNIFPDGSRIFAACKTFVQIRPIAVQYAYDPVIFWQKGKSAIYNGRDYHVGNTNPSSRIPDDDVKFHSCPRPLDTIEYIIRNWCKDGGIAVDWFIGSGTTAVAAKRLSRHWWGCEIDPDTAERARQRVQNTQPPLFVMQPEQAAFELNIGGDS